MSVEESSGSVHELVERRHELIWIALSTANIDGSAESTEVRVIDVQHAIVILERSFVATKLFACDLGATQQNAHTFIVARGDIVFTLQHVDQLGPLPQCLVEIGKGV